MRGGQARGRACSASTSGARSGASHAVSRVCLSVASCTGRARSSSSWDYDMFADTSKARRHGFHTFVDTEEMLRGQFEDLRRRRIIAS